MSFSLAKMVPPQLAHCAPIARASVASVYQESAPDFANTSTTRRLTAGSFSGLPHPEQANTAIGTPHTRCREIHQSGRVSTMLEIRSSPQAGSHLTFLISSSAPLRKVASPMGAPSKLRRFGGVKSRAEIPSKADGPLGGNFVSIEMNHCSVARKITGLWQRQQCGYWCSTFSECNRTPRLLSSSMIGSFALRTFRPSYSGNPL